MQQREYNIELVKSLRHRQSGGLSEKCENRGSLQRVEQEDDYEQMEIAKVEESYILMKGNKSPVK